MKTDIYVKSETIDKMLENAEYEIFDEVFGKMTVVVAKLESGFTLVGSSACVDPENYDREMGIEICKEQMKKELWKLEGYALQKKVSEQ